MNGQKLFLFDFDGVIVDGMNEYWHSSILAYEKLLPSSDISINQDLNKQFSNTFKEIRPWVKYGWEMVLIVHEIFKKENPLNKNNKLSFINNYRQNCKRILNNNSWIVEDIQRFLNESRQEQIDKNFEMWVNLHHPFYEVLDFIENIKQKNIKTAIITTKGKTFAAKILDRLNIFPDYIFGYESGKKTEIAKELSNKYKILGFLEDRKETLMDIKLNNYTKEIPCYLADWGYLKDSDRINLPKEIRLLNLKDLENLLAI